MDSVLLSQPAPSHSNNSAASSRPHTLLNSLFSASRTGANANHDDIERPSRPVENSPAGQSAHRRLGLRVFGNHAESRPSRIGRAMLSPRWRTGDSQDAPSGPYVPIGLQPVAAENHWGDQAPSSNGGSGRSERNEGTRGRRPQRQRRHEHSDFHGRSCTSVLKERNLRKKMYTLITAGIFFLAVLAIYIAFTASHATLGRELHILLIFMLLILAIVFCHSFVRFILAVARGHRGVARNRVPSEMGSGGYAQPARPIPVVLAADEEAMSESNSSREKIPPPPPAYGLWRSSVRINPDMLYWQRVNGSSPRKNPSGKTTTQRPPSYASDNGVDYVIEAQPRSFTSDRGQGCHIRMPEVSEH